MTDPSESAPLDPSAMERAAATTEPVPADPPAAPPPHTPAGSVFVSHSSRNAAEAMAIVAALESASVPCWVAPRDIPAGSDWNHSIMSGINACRAMILVFTRHSADSGPVQREVERALNRKVPVIPVRLEQAAPSPAMEFMISTSQWVDAFPPPVDRHLEKVVAAVKKALQMAHAAPRPDPHAPPKYVGHYRILKRLGKGGMGTVYKAEQHTPVKRTVAVKLIKPGFDSAEVIARFESERQALARMDHPNVAKVLDAGTDDRGRPYFVMEYVPGVPITDYADQNKLSVRQRLELFMQACDAISHAHTKSLLHHDIKPTNVLAYTADGKATVKVIDFGVAKALTGDRLSDRTFNTEWGQAIGTYESMSPEQADGSPDIDTRTDVYSLGVLLYELLSGAKPFEKEALAKAADAEVRRIIREVEPPKPSTQLSSLRGEAATRAAAARKGQLDALAKELRSELEWIPLKAMRKERARRYAGPRELAEDVARYLAGEPLLAGPESRAYRLRKFARRRRAPPRRRRDGRPAARRRAGGLRPRHPRRAASHRARPDRRPHPAHGGRPAKGRGPAPSGRPLRSGGLVEGGRWRPIHGLALVRPRPGDVGRRPGRCRARPHPHRHDPGRRPSPAGCRRPGGPRSGRSDDLPRPPAAA